MGIPPLKTKNQTTKNIFWPIFFESKYREKKVKKIGRKYGRKYFFSGILRDFRYIFSNVLHFLKSPNRSEFLNGKFCRFYLHDSSYLQLSLDSSIYIPCTTLLWVNDFVSKVCDITGISNENPMFSGGVKQGVIKKIKISDPWFRGNAGKDFQKTGS